MDKIISFPHMGNYHIALEFLFKSLFKDLKIKASPPITKRTIELGSKYSPDFVCIPFKYNLGNYIEALENGANILMQSGGGCRYGYYGEVQEQILRDLGYDFEFISILSDDVKPIKLYNICRRLGCNLSIYRFLYYIKLAFNMVIFIDKIEGFIRENIGFELEKNSFENLHKEFLNELRYVKNFKMLSSIYINYEHKFRCLKIYKPCNCLKVGLVGELYTLMEPFSNFFIEKELAKYKIVMKRFTTATFLMFEKSKVFKKILKEAEGYLKYHIGADGTDSVANSKRLAIEGFDGIIHVKPFGCTPEVNAMPILQNIAKDYKIPILYISFDSQTAETGIKTRLEAFNDMIVMRKGKLEKQRMGS
ncbi:MAG: 2-hydroxyacyl-CoA dehydratase [Oscillospiraceae bacterium]|nr:2-hydroxyacyl-CoA dehydratase [Oscillospiraceae bacterium]